MAHEKTAAENERRLDPIFVHSELDDYGLTPLEFRAYGRVKRRQDSEANGRACDESITRMARAIGVKDETLSRALKVLTLAGLLSATPRDGFTTVYRLNPTSDWKPKENLEEIRALCKPKKRTTPRPTGGGPTRKGPPNQQPPVIPIERGEGVTAGRDLPPPLQRDEGIPFEGIPFEGDPNKEITHREAPVARYESSAVCASPLPNLINVDQEEKEPNPWDIDPWSYNDVMEHVRYRESQGDEIRNEIGLVKSILKKRDPDDYVAIENSLTDIDTEQAYQAERRLREEAERLRRQDEQEEQERQVKAARQREEQRQAEEEEARRQRETEEAPQREAEQIAKEAERRAREAADEEAIAKMKRMIADGKKVRPAAA